MVLFSLIHKYERLNKWYVQPTMFRRTNCTVTYYFPFTIFIFAYFVRSKLKLKLKFNIPKI